MYQYIYMCIHCINVYVYVCIYIYIHISMYVYMHPYVYGCVHHMHKQYILV